MYDVYCRSGINGEYLKINSNSLSMDKAYHLAKDYDENTIIWTHEYTKKLEELKR